MVSIIVPVYNAQRYLRRCLNSLLNQTYSDCEIILVDDGSTDASLSICNEYASKYKQFVVIHKENSGVSDTRNTGFDHSTGQYIIFIDADDYIEPQMIEQMYHELTSRKVDAVRCEYIIEPVGEKGAYIYDGETIQNDMTVLVKSLFSLHMYLPAYTPLLLYKREYYVRFDSQLDFLEDLEVAVRFYRRINSIYLMPDRFYHYWQNESSATKAIERAEHNIRHTITAFNQISQELDIGSKLDLVSLMRTSEFTLIIEKLKVLARNGTLEIERVVKKDIDMERYKNIVQTELSILNRLIYRLLKRKFYRVAAIIIWLRRH
ncbi:MAG: glycosyltransferase family 2 protein [Eubacterium sp.]|jgi:glycosyltransferase involved in cell wall biosynthesis